MPCIAYEMEVGAKHLIVLGTLCALTAPALAQRTDDVESVTLGATVPTWQDSAEFEAPVLPETVLDHRTSPVQSAQWHERGGQGRTWQAVSAERLDGLRGGFDINGLQVSFGIARTVYVNGNLVTTTSFNIPDLANITSQQAQTLATQLGNVTLVQNGAGNSFSPGAIGVGALLTVVQNTLNNQTIKSLTTVNVAVNSLGLLKTMNAQASLTSALSAVAGGR